MLQNSKSGQETSARSKFFNYVFIASFCAVGLIELLTLFITNSIKGFYHNYGNYDFIPSILSSYTSFSQLHVIGLIQGIISFAGGVALFFCSNQKRSFRIPFGIFLIILSLFIFFNILVYEATKNMKLF